MSRGVVASGLACLTAAVFLPAVACGFVNIDDPHYVLRNRLVLGGLSPAGIRGAWTDVVFCNWAPLTVLSLELDTSLFGTRPWGYHLTNVLLHAATTAVLFLALAGMTGSTGRSAAAALLVAVHPLRVESVAWIAERKDVLSVFFLAAALFAYDRYRLRPTAARYLAVVAAMLASLLAKATAVTLPMLLLILDVWPLRRFEAHGEDRTAATRLALVLEKLPLLALSAVFAAVTLWTQRSAIQPEDRLPLLTTRIPNAIIASGAYVGETVLPLRLHPAHEHAGEAGIPADALGASAAVIAVLVAVALRLRRVVPACPAGIAWFFLALAPVLGVVTQPGFQSRADRFTYVPHIGLMIAVVWTAATTLSASRAPQRAAAALLAIVAAACILATRAQIGIWRDSLTLWNHVLAVEPASALANLCLGEEWYDRGQPDRAVDAFRRSLAIRPTKRAHDWLGLAFASQGQLAEAYAQHAEATRLDPAYWEAHNNAGIALARMGRMRDALERFALAAALAPDDPDVRHNLAQAHAELANAAHGDPDRGGRPSP